MSTREFQDPRTSLGWQRESAQDLIQPHGRIVREFFDVGCSRRLPWSHRPQARQLLQKLDLPDRGGIDAIVVGEAERAFCAGQLTAMIPLFARLGIRVWLPEFDGPFDPDDTTHRVLALQLGAQARREVLRTRFRTLAAMRSQVREQGRYLGGRPPYGYCLVDDGEHPNKAHARWGRRIQRLDPDPRTAGHVRWIFAERLKSRSVAGIARELNETGIACPSGADVNRNQHRHGDVWTEPTVASILANPRYTGYQVWNRQPTDHTSVPAPAPSSGGPSGHEHEYGRLPIQRWGSANDWVVSRVPSHPALVSTEEFIAVQAIHARRPDRHGNRRTYLLASLLKCGLCGRRLDSHWVNNRPGYRCRHGRRTSTHSTGWPYLYVREDEVLALLQQDPDLSQANPTEKALVTALRDHHVVIDCTVQDGRLSIAKTENGPRF
ncbi:hypothetical protein Kisp02_68330 [Kineosporia sp. NBRC 101731]|nr:hypothetical protein Kisp02_68330 [Kineosporia sp. NBRC 101731]